MTSGSPTPLPFDAIVVTSASPLQASAYTLELELRRRLGLIPESTLIVAVPDPAGYRVGSGGATLNALAVVSQRLCYQAGYSELNARFLRTKRILIMHSGGDSQRIPLFSVRGKAFSSLPSTDPAEQHVNAPIDFLIDKLIKIFRNAPEGGTVITATDVLLLMPDSYQWNPAHSEGITGIGIYADQSYGKGHGVYVVEPSVMDSPSIEHVPIVNIMQKPSIQQMKAAGAIRSDGSIIIDSGIIYFSPLVTATFLSLQGISPLDSCTDTGLDHGNVPFRFELYTDIILATNPAVSREEFLSMPLPAKDSDVNRVERARRLLWKLLRPFTFYLLADQQSHFSHVGTTAEYLQILNQESVFRVPLRLSKRARSFVEYPSLIKGGVLINSILAGHGTVEEGALVENCYLRGHFHVARSSVVSGVRSVSGVQTQPHMVVQEIQLSNARARSDPRVRHLLGVKGESRSLDHSGPFFVAPHFTDGSKYVDTKESEGDEVLRVIIVFGVYDGIKDPYKTKKSTLCNRHWSHYFPPEVFTSGRIAAPDPASPLLPTGSPHPSLHSFSHLLLDPDDDGVWPAHVPDASRTLWNARIYPVLRADASESILWLQYDHPPSVQTLCEWKQSTRVSLEDILSLSDPPQEFYWRARASFLVDLKEMESILLERRDRPLLPIIQRCQPEYKADLLSTLDAIASTGPLDVCARTLCTIADVLASLPGTHMFTRTGPARNPQWANAVKGISAARNSEEQAKGVAELAAMREQWLKVGSSQLYMRAARHYDGAWASLTRKGVETVKLHSVGYEERRDVVMVGQTVEATSPVRIDLCGGWSDTPPITYEHGGKVTNVAVKIDGQHPVGASAKSFFLPPSSDKVIIVKTGRSRTLTLDETQAIQEDDPDDTVFLSKPSDLSDYNDPTAPAALIKCVILALGIVDLSSPLSLPQQIQRAIPHASFPAAASGQGVGLYIRSWSTLPQGTGLGVSSILAADIVAAVAAVVGQQFSLHNLMHVVLMVEQMLTTGGGWQDQVGGCYPGFKMGVSTDHLPLLVEVQPIRVPPAFLDEFSAHCLLIHTGQSRLAKNLLGTVLRRWYQRDEVVTRTVDSLCTEAESMRAAIEQGNLAEVGRLLQVYWDLKKVMASPMPTTLKQAKEAPVEPEHIARLSTRLRPFVHGLSLLGAGGGGFMCIITKDRVDAGVKHEVQAVLDQLNTERRAAVAREKQRDIKDAASDEDFADDWPTGDYLLYGAQVCEKGMTISVK